MFFRAGTSSNTDQRLWPVFVLLIAVVTLPTCSVLWFMSRAIQNEEPATRQRLVEIHSAQLKSVARYVDDVWRAKLTFPVLHSELETRTPEIFADIVKTGQADAALFFQNNRLLYPETAADPVSAAAFDSPLWREARDLENVWNNPGEAAGVYAQIAGSAGMRDAAAARMAEARSLNKAGRPSDAIALLIREFSDTRYKSVFDLERRSVRAAALMFALDLMARPDHLHFQKTAETLAEALNDYAAPAMPSGQRRFLMRRLQSFWPQCPPFPAQQAEELAALFNEISPDELSPGQMRPTAVSDIWAYSTPDGTVIALFSREHIMKFMDDVLSRQEAMPGVHFSVTTPGAETEAFMTEETGDLFPEWKLALLLQGPDPFESAANRTVAIYLWIGEIGRASCRERVFQPV
jgi:hypothetical protein